MATTFTTALHDEGSASPFTPVPGAAFRIYDRYDLTAALIINDLIRGPYLPKGLVITDASLVCDDLDTHTTPTVTLTLRVTNGTTTKNLFVASTVAQAGGMARADVAAGNGLYYEVPAAGYWLEILAVAAPATGATTGDIDFGLEGTMRKINADQ